MSEQELGKKLVEEEWLRLFVEEYEHVTGVPLHCVQRAERPDFICDRQGERVGVELVQVIKDPRNELPESDVVILVQEAVYEKEGKMASGGWSYAKRTILVVQLMDVPSTDIIRLLTEELMEEMSTTGFIEIWVANYTVTEGYDTVQLLGVKPAKWRGLHRHRFQGTKPYG